AGTLGTRGGNRPAGAVLVLARRGLRHGYRYPHRRRMDGAVAGVGRRGRTCRRAGSRDSMTTLDYHGPAGRRKEILESGEARGCRAEAYHHIPRKGYSVASRSERLVNGQDLINHVEPGSRQAHRIVRTVSGGDAGGTRVHALADRPCQQKGVYGASLAA